MDFNSQDWCTKRKPRWDTRSYQPILMNHTTMKTQLSGGLSRLTDDDTPYSQIMTYNIRIITQTINNIIRIITQTYS